MMLAIARRVEAHHIQIAGDTGSGKSTLIRKILYQIEARGDTAVVFDPEREYLKEFYLPARGDVVLNPSDQRCPWWNLGSEAPDEPHATAVAAGLFPSLPNSQEFFLIHSRAIFAFLLANFKPTVADLGNWMAHPEEIDKRVAGTEHEITLTKNAAPQRAGILGTLNQAGQPLRMMPPDDGRQHFSVRDWAKARRGWIFVTSTPTTFEAVRPLQGLWLDMLILALQTKGGSGAHRVWLVLDEVQELSKLPQLPRALTRQRKSDNPIVLGFQGMAQIDASYGRQAETMLSQAYTNFILRTRESRAAEHSSNLIGKVELERVRETRPAFLWLHPRHRSYSTERVIQPLVLASEIQGLPDLCGFFVQGEHVVRISFPVFAVRERASGLIERIIPPLHPSPPPPSLKLRRKERKTRALIERINRPLHPSPSDNQGESMATTTATLPRSAPLSTRYQKRVVFTMGGKGGVGKTAVALALADWYAYHDRPVTLIDLDVENKALGSLRHFYKQAQKLDIYKPAGLDVLVDHLSNDRAPVILADMGAGSGKVSHEWFDTMYYDVHSLGIAFTAIGVVTPDPASVDSVLAWAARLQDRVQYLIVENAPYPNADFEYWHKAEQAIQFRELFQPAVVRCEYRLDELEHASRQSGLTLQAIADGPSDLKPSLITRAKGYRRRLLDEIDKAEDLLLP